MRHIICAVRDRQLDAFMRPFAAQSRGQAIRSFGDETNRNGSDLHAHPEDYELYELGTFDDDTGALTPHAKPASIAIATNLIERK